MTALSPGPWFLRDGYVVAKASGAGDAPAGQEVAIAQVRSWNGDPTDAETAANGRAMASAHEALAVLAELAMPEDKLQMAYTQATGQLVGVLHGAAWRRYQAWVWRRNDVLRTKAAAVLEKAGGKP